MPSCPLRVRIKLERLNCLSACCGGTVIEHEKENPEKTQSKSNFEENLLQFKKPRSLRRSRQTIKKCQEQKYKEKRG